jgi:hypothetical protein
MTLAGFVTLPLPAAAELHDRGGGLIYDDVLDVTWLQNANPAGTPMSWTDAVAWVANFEYVDTVRGVTWSDWRLPLADPVNGVTHVDTFSTDGTTDNGYNIVSTNNELGYMFHVNLGVLSYADTDGNWPQPDFGFRTELSGPFFNLNLASAVPTWTGTEYPLFDGMAYLLPFQTGFHHAGAKDTTLLVWPVRDGDVAAP